MNVIVKENRDLVIRQAVGTQNENEATIINLQVPEQFENYNKKIVFIIGSNTYWDLITDNTYDLTKVHTVNKTIDFYIWITHEDFDFRSKTYTITFFDNKDASNQITPEEIGAVNQILALVDEAIEETNNLDIEATKENHIATITITHKDKTTTSVNILDGEQGPQGPKGEDGQDGYTPQRGKDYWTDEDIFEIENDINNTLMQYFNQPFIEFEIDENGNLIAEVKPFGED